MSNYDYAPIENEYNVEEFEKFVEAEIQKPGNENNRYELIDGVIYMMSSPRKIHQRLAKFIYDRFNVYFLDKECEVYFAPVDVYLFDKKRFPLLSLPKKECKDAVEPDLLVLCDDSKYHDDGIIYGAPDLVIEIVSKSSLKKDYMLKYYSYMKFGVKEYWIVDPINEKIIVYCLIDDDLSFNPYTFDDVVKSKTFNDLSVDFRNFVEYKSPEVS